jgi:glycosyltransferase involved in cell wall biosynthesis
MSSTAVLVAEPAPGRQTADVDIVVPVYNEQDDLEASIRRLCDYLSSRFPLSWTVTIADNASQDRTWGIACRLAQEFDGVRAIHLDQKGRGRALRAAWSMSEAAVVAYMDVDLSTDLDALLPLVAPLLSGHSDIAIGSRLAPGARVTRGFKRETISRSYNLLLKATMHNRFSDAQCGFKAVRRDVARALLPLVEDNGWFFDTELLVLAERNGLRVHEIPVDWNDDADSRVDLLATALGDVKGLWRVGRRLLTGHGDLTEGAFRPRTRAGRATGYQAALAAATRPLAATLLVLVGLGLLGVRSWAAVLVAVTATNLVAAAARFLFLPASSTPMRHYRT